MWLLGYVFLGFSGFIAFVNICGSVGAWRNHIRGIDSGYSQVPLFSLVFAVLSWLILRESLGLWIFLPAALDPGTWVSLCIPWVLWQCYHDASSEKHGNGASPKLDE